MGQAFQLNSYLRGMLVVSTVNFTNTAGALTDPTAISAVVYVPGSVALTYIYPNTIARSAQGIYTLQVDTTTAVGEWCVHWSGTGTIQAVWDDIWMVYQNRP